jgi:hypothetical protein
MFICRFVVYVSWHTANNIHPIIKFTHETSRNNISFLDAYTTCENCSMSTDIYNKPTDKHVNFMSTSSMKRNQESGLRGADCMISFFKFLHEDVGVWRCHLFSHSGDLT